MLPLLIRCLGRPAALGLCLVAAIGFPPSAAAAGCRLGTGHAIKQVVLITLDNLHARREDPRIPADLELMPHLRDFLIGQGTLLTNHRPALVAEAGTNALAILTGLYGDHMGVATGDAVGTFLSDGTAAFSSAFAYWTARSDDGLAHMLAASGAAVPAPWAPFTRAGCDVGVFAAPNLALESIPSDVVLAFGRGSAEAQEAQDDPVSARADFLGIAVHCALYSPLCRNAALTRPDLLGDEPVPYSGYSALFGHARVQPAIAPGRAITDLGGAVIADAFGHPGFPNRFAARATQALGYGAAMLDAGIPVVYLAIGDPHITVSPSGEWRALGPGEAELRARLASEDAAFQAFFDRLAAHGITTANSLFVVTPAELARFAGPAPQPPGCDGLATSCRYSDPGALEVSLDRLVAAERHDVTAFDLIFGAAASLYLRGNPAPGEPATRQLEQDLAGLQIVDPSSGAARPLTEAIADRATMQFLHLAAASAARRPSVLLFAQSGIEAVGGASAGPCAAAAPCIQRDPASAWVRAGLSEATTQSWMAMVGPGVKALGETDAVASSVVDMRPTLLALLALRDDYRHDGHVLARVMTSDALPAAINASEPGYTALADLCRDLDAPLGVLGRRVLARMDRAVRADDDAYRQALQGLDALATVRDRLALQEKALLASAAFDNRPLDPAQLSALISESKAILALDDPIAQFEP